MSRTRLVGGLAAALAIVCPLSAIQGQITATVRLVEVYATVSDEHGKPVDGLPKDRFQVLDEGLP